MLNAEGALVAEVAPNILRFERRPFAGTFTVRDAALFLRATTPPENVVVSRWRQAKHPKAFAATTRALYTWIRLGLEWDEPYQVTHDDRVITFEDLIRLRLVALLRSRGFSYAHIRDAEDFIRQTFAIPQPFVTERFWVAGPILFGFEKQLISVSPGTEFQTAFQKLRDFFTPVEHGLSFGSDGVAEVWRPSPEVLIDPTIQFGSPCIEGTRIETEALWSFFQAGDSPESLARMYGLNEKQVDAALRWEQRIAHAVAA